MKFLRTIAYLAFLPVLLPFWAFKWVLNWFFDGPDPKPVRIVDFADQEAAQKSQNSENPESEKDLERALIAACKGQIDRNPIDIIAKICEKNKIKCPPPNITVENNTCSKCSESDFEKYTYEQYKKDYANTTEIELCLEPNATLRRPYLGGAVQNLKDGVFSKSGPYKSCSVDYRKNIIKTEKDVWVEKVEDLKDL